MNKLLNKGTIIMMIILLASPIFYSYSVNLAPASECEEGIVDWEIDKEGETEEVRIYNYGEEEMKYKVELDGSGAQFADITSDKYFTLTPENNREEVKIFIEPREGYNSSEIYDLEVRASFHIVAEGSEFQAGANSCYNLQFTGERTSPLPEPKEDNGEADEKPRLNISRTEDLEELDDEKGFGIFSTNLPIAIFILIVSALIVGYLYKKRVKRDESKM